MELIGAIDQGTSSSRFILFQQDRSIVASSQTESRDIKLSEGWIQQDPGEILQSVKNCIEDVAKQCSSKGIKLDSIKGIGIANQRETTILWDKTTGKWLYDAIVWSDTRTSQIANRFATEKGLYHLQPKCGLPIFHYFSALKIIWLMENCEPVKEAIAAGNCLFGTVDTWLIWNLTGGTKGGVHVTDVTNASRTMLMNLQTQQWDKDLLDFFNIPATILPTIKSSAECYGKMVDTSLKGVPLCGCLGDQSAALLGQYCLTAGEAKNTYGTGAFLLFNTGTDLVISKKGLLTTVAYKLGPNETTQFALEGAIATAGQVVQWLRDEMKFISSASEIESLAAQEKDTGGVCFVSAFQGLFAPYWNAEARGMITGLTHKTNRSHIARAALEGMCLRTWEIVKCMSEDCGVQLTQLKVDGGMTANDLFVQMQSDLLGATVLRTKMAEATAFGVAMAAGIASGAWQLSKMTTPLNDPFSPVMSTEECQKTRTRWEDAMKRCNMTS
ncbi:glycerol kinase-like [Dysidea avara]|uniref:glycerol kinase-like n=1 Tax=Dysidea avara TaxID=196820 RepID=UPI003317EC23